ncbi:MAG: class II glutamine amidotransferase [Candidatus Thorarchaeota archaeon]
MCDLLGMSFSNEVRAGISLNLFQIRGKENPDGWGLAFYKDSYLQIIKEAKSATQSTLYDFIERYPQSDTFISHVRRSTRGQPSYVNTHPFYRVLETGGIRREYCFAHNGTLTDTSMLQLTYQSPLGSTDSELLFCYLLERIKERDPRVWKTDDFQYMEGVLQEINSQENTLNCMMSDGEYLVCYSDENQHNGGLRFAPHKHPYGLMDFVEEGTTLGTVDIQGANVGGMEPSPSSGYIVVTRELVSPLWTEFDRGQLMVFKHGEIVYRGRP